MAGPAEVDGQPARPDGVRRSTTVARMPWRCSQYASAGPATLAPEISTSSCSSSL